MGRVGLEHGRLRARPTGEVRFLALQVGIYVGYNCPDAAPKSVKVGNILGTCHSEYCRHGLPSCVWR